MVQLCSALSSSVHYFLVGKGRAGRAWFCHLFCASLLSIAAFVMFAGHWPGRVPDPRLKRAALPCWPDLQFAVWTHFSGVPFGLKKQPEASCSTLPGEISMAETLI